MYLLILLFLTLLVFGTLFKSFGFTMGPEKERAVKDFVNKMSNNTVDGQVVKKNTPFTGEETVKNNLKEEKDDFLTKMYENYINKKKSTTVNTFNKDLFLKSSEKAVVTILEYFSSENLEFLKNLLTDNMYTIFEKQINTNKANNVKYKTIVLSIDQKDICDISEYDTKIKVKFSMKQFNYVEDNEGNLIRGSKDIPQDINEIWTFIKGNNNMWLLNSIE